MSFFKVRPLSNLKKTIIQNIAFMIAIGIVVFLIIYTFMSHYLKDSIETEENNVSAKAATQFSDYFSQISSYSFNLSNTYTIPNSSLSEILRRKFFFNTVNVGNVAVVCVIVRAENYIALIVNNIHIIFKQKIAQIRAF